jgi:hypothetical protein
MTFGEATSTVIFSSSESDRDISSTVVAWPYPSCTPKVLVMPALQSIERLVGHHRRRHQN